MQKKNYLNLQLGDIPKSYSKMTNTDKLTKYKFKVNYKEGVKKFIDWFIKHHKKKLINTAVIYSRINSRKVEK